MAFEIKDSGERKQFDSGMMRDTAEGKTNYLSIRFGPMLRRWAEHLTKGRAKYPDPFPGLPNWTLAEGADEYLRAKESAARHFEQWLAGERDEDHAAGVFFNINLAEYVLENDPAVDSGLGVTPRPRYPEPQAKPWHIIPREADEAKVKQPIASFTAYGAQLLKELFPPEQFVREMRADLDAAEAQYADIPCVEGTESAHDISSLPGKPFAVGDRVKTVPTGRGPATVVEVDPEPEPEWVAIRFDGGEDGWRYPHQLAHLQEECNGNCLECFCGPEPDEIADWEGEGGA